jgi:hypothetical protein
MFLFKVNRILLKREMLFEKEKKGKNPRGSVVSVQPPLGRELKLSGLRSLESGVWSLESVKK